MTPPTDTGALISEIQYILDFVKKREADLADLIRQVQPHYRDSARNLVHYMALRSFDLRPIQEELSMMSISSLGHSEGYTLTNLKKILHLLRLVSGASDSGIQEDFHSPLNYYRSKEQLRENTTTLFGAHPGGHCTRIMVTLSREVAYDYELAQALLNRGMNIARINTSHEEPAEWEAMIRNIRRAEQATGKSCLIYMDLSGPKLRTGAIDSERTVYDPLKGDFLLLREDDEICMVQTLPDRAAQPEEACRTCVAISLPSVFADVRPGQRIFFDDGKIKAEITEVSAQGFGVRITYTGMNGAKLRADKGINLPDTRLCLPSLTQDDLANLPFIAQYADIVGYSFVRTPEDVAQLQAELHRLGRSDLGIILKIETKESFENLPMLLLTAMRSPKVGVMIARGDLAVEIGFERIAEVQEEILWICESAHIPGIWATQVLEKLASKGIATRAEITDAAMAARAECVMLNKGPYIADAVATLNDIIRRMESHQFKRMSNLRPLQVARQFLEH
jgi:pyruvate kinase